MTKLPTWTVTPTDGQESIEVPLPGGVTVGPVLAALARVVGVLAGEPEVTFAGITTATRDVSWRELVDDVGRQFTGARRLEVGAALVVEVLESSLRLRYDLRALDRGYAERLAGYLRRALAAIAADPDGRVDEVDLLSEEELYHLLFERGGGARALPSERFHEIFARRAADRPDDCAVVYAGQSFSYGWLNAAANRVAHALLAQGVRAEDVVMTATERTPQWLAAIIGIFKAGCAYLPAEPDFPAAHLTTLRHQSGCRIVLTQSVIGDELAAALAEPGVTALALEDLGSYPDTDPPVAVALDQLAYIYFTSGSTGRPKGAMCTHHGMINHLLAKVTDLEIDDTSVVVQNAQQTFDISLWQLIAPLMVGGRTLIVAREDILDVRRFLATVSGGGATILQVVPSYLDLLLRTTDHPTAFGRVRYVCATGEALSKNLVNRWFARWPDIRLVNAYGATEASDDTTHEVMSRPPVEDLTPVGRPVGNVTVYVLGLGDTLVPLGALGEIVFSGICVGRGYINDPERTAQAYAEDPFRPGQRIYRSGDFGRWLPTGSLEFHGRRDEQVKVNGIRVELGEVEARLLDHPGVLSAAVIITPLPGMGKSLVAFYEGDNGLTGDELRTHLQGRLPATSVPARVFPVDRLPLNSNGKVDKKVLAARAQDLAAEAVTEHRPFTPTEERLAAAWAVALSLPIEQIGGDDHFFKIGGGSLSALRMVAQLDGLITLPQLIAHPVLSELAAVVDKEASA
jgi:amino acid adenylation domain-containing protein